MTTRHGAWGLVLALALVGCGGDDATTTTPPPAAAAPSTTVAATTVAPETAAPTTVATTPATIAVANIEGLVRYANATEGFVLYIPEDWEVIAAEDIDLPAITDELSDSSFAPMADDIATAFSRGGVMFVFDFAGSGPEFVDNINVLKTPAAPAPIPALVDPTLRQFAQLGATELAVDVVDIAAGDALRVAYTLAEVDIDGVAYTVRDGDTDWVFTLSSADMASLDIDFDEVMATLQFTSLG